MSPDEISARKLQLSSQQLTEILTDFSKGKPSFYHGIHTPHRNVALEAQKQEAELSRVADFRVLTIDLYQYHPDVAVDFALKAAALDDAKEGEIKHLEFFRAFNHIERDPLRISGLQLLEDFREQGYHFTQPAALKWLAVCFPDTDQPATA